MSMLRANLQSFLFGAAASLGAGYYFLHQDIWRSADLLGESLGSLVTETKGRAQVLEQRVAKLEAEVQALKVSSRRGRMHADCNHDSPRADPSPTLIAHAPFLDP